MEVRAEASVRVRVYRVRVGVKVRGEEKGKGVVRVGLGGLGIVAFTQNVRVYASPVWQLPSPARSHVARRGATA